MNMQAQDIRERNSNELIVTSDKFNKEDNLSLNKLITRYSLLVTCYLLLFLMLLVTVVYAQQPAAQPRSPESLEEERLNIIRADIQKKIEQLEKLKREIEEAQKALQKARDEEILKVAKIYAAMPPERAARKLEALSEDMAVALLTSLQPRIAGRIMAQMNPEKAASISKKMLERGRVVTEKTSQ